MIGDVVELGETKKLESGIRVFDFILRTWGRGPQGRVLFEYHPITIWGDALDKFKEVITLGKTVRVDGTLTHRTWEDKFQKKHRRTSVRGLVIKEISLEIPPVTDDEKAKFSEQQKSLFAGKFPSDGTASGN